jgi:hypothetical protein
MIGVRLAVEQNYFGHGQNAGDDGVDLGGVAAFGKIGYALYELSRHIVLQRITRRLRIDVAD